jgi:hypothetical protein
MQIKKIKQLIKEAIENLPLDLRFNQIKNQLSLSLKEIQQIEEKEDNKNQIMNRWKSNSNLINLNQKQKESVLNVIEQLIEKEKNNLDKIGKNENQNNIFLN